jgi:hypothetical protein
MRGISKQISEQRKRQTHLVAVDNGNTANKVLEKGNPENSLRRRQRARIHTESTCPTWWAGV